MNVLILDGSPKPGGGNSRYFSRLLGGLGPGVRVERIKILPKHYTDIFARFDEIDTLVLTIPVYVDAVPASMLRFLTQAEQACHAQGCSFSVYSIANCGFFEGYQCKNELAVLANWCARAGLQWRGGIGLGAGEMLGVLRFIPPVSLGVSALVTLISVIASAVSGQGIGAALMGFNWQSPLISLGWYMLFSAGMFWALGGLRRNIRAGKTMESRYATVICPRFLFVLFANLFWIIRAALCGVGFWRIRRKQKIE